MLMSGEQVMRRPKPKRRSKPVRMVTIVNGKEIAQEQAAALRLEASESLHRARMSRRLDQIERRFAHAPERRSVARAMLAVEARFVAAMWVLERSLPPEGVKDPPRHGLDYLREKEDHFLAGQWQHVAPRPAVSTSKEIDAARQAQGWVRYLDDFSARVLTIGAMTKRGDAGRTVNWMRVRSRLPELDGYTARSLQGFYTGALRDIVAAMTHERIAA